MAKQRAKVKPGDTPLSVAIEGQQVVIRIGVDLLAYSAEHCPALWVYETNPGSDFPYCKVSDNAAFAHDVLRALQHEEEDGSGPLSDLFDEAIKRAIDDGADGIDYEFKQGTHATPNPEE